MKQYIGTKIVHAESLDRGDGMNGYRVVYSDGYESWSPTAAFEEAYRANGEMNFGHALEMLKRGYPVQRAGWNGSGMFVYHVPGNRYAPSTFVGRSIAEGQPDGLVPYLPYLALKTVSGAIATWVPSSTDVLADDWCVVDGGA